MDLSSIYKNYYSDIEPLIFEEILLSDPTSNMIRTKCGHYVKCIANLYRKGDWKTGDRPETISALTLLEKHKAKLPENKRDVNSYRSVSELYDIVKQFEEVRTQRELKSVCRDGAEKVYEDDEWLIVVPHTVEAAKQYWKHTKWCTSAENNNMFEYYNKKGKLYIFIDKSNNRKYQVHFETEQFMDEEDKPVLLRKVRFNEGVKLWFNSIGKELLLVYDWVGSFYDGFVRVMLNNKWNFINTEGKLLSDMWFYNVCSFNEGFAHVELNGKWNYINTEGKLLLPQWFDWVGGFNEGFAKVKLNGKGYNFINKECEYLSSQWFDYVWDFQDGLAMVYLNDKYNFINQDEKIILQQWFDKSWFFQEGFAMVKLNGKYNFTDTEGKLLSPQWFDDVCDFQEGFAKVKLNGKGYNFINKECEYLSSQWFDLALGFESGFAEVELNGKWYNMNTKGELF